MKTIKIVGLSLLLLGLFSVHIQAVLAQSTNNQSTNTTQTNAATTTPDSGREASIAKYLCTPGGEGGLVGCIKKGYSFILTIAIAASVLLIVIAGYLYITGTEQSVTQAKSIISTTIAGLAILLLTFVILRQINPDLVELKGLEALQVNKPPETTFQQTSTANTEGPGSGGKAATKCLAQASSGYPKCPEIPGLVNAGVPCKNFCNVVPGGAESLRRLKTETDKKNLDWRVTEAYPPTSIHKSSCHYDGRCVDLNLTGSQTKEAYESLCAAIKAVGGMSIYNESHFSTPSCGAWTGDPTPAHLHINF